LVLEALARATGLALTYRAPADSTPEGDDGYTVTEWLGTAADAEGLQGAERRHKLMVAELQHRVRNILSLVRSIVRRTAETSESTEDYTAHLEGRVSALGRTQAFVMRQPGAGVDLEELVNAELIAHAVRECCVRSGGPTIRLKAEAAETVGLALHELATNAVKFGALAVPGGHIDITWSRELGGGSPCVRLMWAESGVPIDRAAPRRRGFGTELIERTAPYELRGKSMLRFDSDGVRCTIDIPFTPDNVVADFTAPAVPAAE
jgi:two-component system CheB/CheR fusion protein